MTKKASATELRVGAFVVVALLIGGVLAFVIGSQRNLFSSKTSYSAVFRDVGGLRPGNGVNVAGVSVGSVDAVTFLPDGRVEVRFRVISSAAELIRGNPAQPADRQDPNREEGDAEMPRPSLVAVGSKGLLGDRLVDITVGDPSLPVWDPETPLFASESGGLMAQAESIANEVERTAQNVRLMTDPWRDQEMSRALEETTINLARATGMLVNGDGTVQRLMTDPGMAEEVQAAIRDLRATSAELRRTTAGVRAITDEVRSGNGTAHALIYGREGRDALENVARASGEVAEMLRAVREGNGTLHALIYEDNAEELLANLTRASANVAAITDDVRAGRGTLGGLLVDPSIYEDVKRLVGDLERNDILRALVRYSIRRDEQGDRAEARETP
ncbi:MAG: MCE family protein [Myxococcales bacterium]|nr:MCE family protein [Myxococcales bacterium]